MIYILPIEQYKERYSYWWHDYIINEFSKVGAKAVNINATSISSSVEVGTVLDAAGTTYFKSQQIANIAQKFKDGLIQPYDSFLICDIWFPGIESLRYMSYLYKIPINIWGVWHAGSITNFDFAEPMNHWSKFFEMGWINMCNGLFVGSDYAKDSIVERLIAPLAISNLSESTALIENIHSYGMPIDTAFIKEIKNKNMSLAKKNIILFPHRPDEEKNPRLFMDVIDQLSYTWDDFEDWQFVFCTSKSEYKSQSKLINAKLAATKRNYMNVEIISDLSREEYYELLDRTNIVVSTTKEENFGYCVVEAAAFGCNVVCPNAFSHPEIFEQDYRLMYDNEEEIADKIIKLADNPIPMSVMEKYVEPYGITASVWAEQIIGKRK